MSTLSLSEVQWIVVDVETTGLDPARDRVTEFAAIPLNSAGVATRALEWRASTSSQADLAEVVSELADRLEAGAVLAAHNLAFDLAFLAALDRNVPFAVTSPVRWVCSMRLTGVPTPLDKLVADLGLTLSGRHSALGDASALASAIATLATRAQSQGASTVAGLAAAWAAGDSATARRRHDASDVRLGWQAILDDLDHVVPRPLLEREQRTAFQRVVVQLRDPAIGPDAPAEYDNVRAVVAEAKLTVVDIEVLLDEQGLLAADRKRRYLSVSVAPGVDADP